VSLNGSLTAVDPKRRGARAKTVLSARVGIAPLDVTAVGDEGRFPGSIWIADWAAGGIVVLEPRPDARCAPVSGRCFRRTTLSGARLDHPTSLAWGRDGRLYVSEQDGLLRVYGVQREAAGFSVSGSETISVVRDIVNHDDDGRPAARLPLFD
jgi:hypothetical protein